MIPSCGPGTVALLAAGRREPVPTKGRVLRWVRFLLVAAALFGVWLLLSGKWDLLHAGTGAVGALVFAATSFPWRRSGAPFPVLRFGAFVPWHLWKVLQSNVHVARLVLSPRLPAAPVLIRRAPRVRGERALTVLGCAVTLTPGTLTIDVREGEMLVHGLDGSSVTDLENDTMEAATRGVFGESAS